MNKINRASLLLVALMVTAMPVQASLSESVKSILARMQNNAIARQITTRRVAVLGAVVASYGLWWWLKSRAEPRQLPLDEQQKLQMSAIKEVNDVAIPWGVAEYHNLSEFNHAVETGSRFDIFLVCQGNYKPLGGQAQDYFSNILVNGHEANDEFGQAAIPPLVNSVKSELNKEGSSVRASLLLAFTNTDRQLRENLRSGQHEDTGAKATVAVIDKQAKEVWIATLGDIQAVAVGADFVLEGPSHRVAYLDKHQAKKDRVQNVLDLYSFSSMKNTAQANEIKSEMEGRAKSIMRSPVTRAFGEFGARKRIPNVIVASPEVNGIPTESINTYDYLVIATDDVWQETNPAPLAKLMPLELVPQAQARFVRGVLNRDKNKILSGDSSDDTILSYAMNMLKSALLKVVDKQDVQDDKSAWHKPDPASRKTPVASMAAMVIDLRPLHSE